MSRGHVFLVEKRGPHWSTKRAWSGSRLLMSLPRRETRTPLKQGVPPRARHDDHRLPRRETRTPLKPGAAARQADAWRMGLPRRETRTPLKPRLRGPRAGVLRLSSSSRNEDPIEATSPATTRWCTSRSSSSRNEDPIEAQRRAPTTSASFAGLPRRETRTPLKRGERCAAVTAGRRSSSSRNEDPIEAAHTELPTSWCGPSLPRRETRTPLKHEQRLLAADERVGLPRRETRTPLKLDRVTDVHPAQRARLPRRETRTPLKPAGDEVRALLRTRPNVSEKLSRTCPFPSVAIVAFESSGCHGPEHGRGSRMRSKPRYCAELATRPSRAFAVSSVCIGPR